MSADQTNDTLRQIAQAATEGWIADALLSRSQASDLEAVISALIEVADRVHAVTLTDLVTALQDFTSLTESSEAPPPDEDEAHRGSHQAHRLRNVLACLCHSAALRQGKSKSSLIVAVPRLGRRTSLRPGRPLYEDERLLMRLIVTGLVEQRPAHHLTAAKYALCEAGCMPGEATAIFLEHLDETRHPSEIRAPGNRNRAARLLPLDDWQSAVLGIIATAVITEGDPDQPLAYHPLRNLPGSSQANMSCHRSLGLLLNAAGLRPHADVTASSISYATAEHAWRNQGPAAAARLLGRFSAQDETAPMAGAIAAMHAERARRDLRRFGTEPTPTSARPAPSFVPPTFTTYDPSK